MFWDVASSVKMSLPQQTDYINLKALYNRVTPLEIATVCSVGSNHDRDVLHGSLWWWESLGMLMARRKDKRSTIS